jgi:hypothetical protein
VKVCPFCAEELEDDAITCTHCGRDVTEVPDRPTEAPRTWRPSAEEIVRRAARGPDRPVGLFGRSGLNRVAAASFLVVIGTAILGTAADTPPALGLALYGVGFVLAAVAIRQTLSRLGERSGFGFALVAAALAVVGLIGSGRALVD